MSVEDRTQVTRPMNGEEYLESIRDGREVWIYEELVEDVITHPVFYNVARWCGSVCRPTRMSRQPQMEVCA